MSNSIFEVTSCVTVAQNVSVSEAAAVFGADLTADPLRVTDDWSIPANPWSDIAVSFVPIKDGVLIVELTSGEGVRAEVLGPLAVDGPAGSGFWPADGGVWFSVGIAGQIRQYEVQDGMDIEPADKALFAGVDLADTDQATVELLGRLTGVSITPELIGQATQFWPIVPVLDKPVAPVVPLHLDPVQAGFWRGDIDVNMCGAENVDHVLQWTEKEQRALCFWAAREALARTDLLGTPALLAMLDSQEVRATFPPDAETFIRNLKRKARRYALTHDFDKRPSDWRIVPRQVDAVGAVIAAVTTADTLDALGGTMVGARMSYYPDQDDWCRTLAQRLTSPRP